MGKKQPARIIATREDADRTLQRIGELRRHVAVAEAEAGEKIDAIRADLVRDTAIMRESLAIDEAALEAWAKGDAKSWEKKSLELNWGQVGFHLGKPAIKLKLAVENVIEKLRGKKMESCIRTIEEVDKEALANYDDEVIAAVGCARTKPKDRFWYECKTEEVK